MLYPTISIELNLILDFEVNYDKQNSSNWDRVNYPIGIR